MQDTQNPITLSQALLELHSSASQPSSSYRASSNGGSQPAPILTHSPALNSLLSVQYGTIHEICGAPGTGKTGIALDLTSQCLEAGHRVLWLTTRGRAASLPLGQAGGTKDPTASPNHFSSQQNQQQEAQSQKQKQQQQQRRLKAPERTWRQLGHMCVDGVSQLFVLFTQWWSSHSHLSQGTRLVVIDDFGQLLRGVAPRMAARVLFEMKRAAREHGFAIIVMSRLLAQWSVTGRRMMMVPGLPALNGVLDGRIALCRSGGRDGSSRMAARVRTGTGPDQAVLEVVRQVQFEILADCVVDAVEKRNSDDDDDDNDDEGDLMAARPEKRQKVRSATDPGTSSKKVINDDEDDEDLFSEIDFDDIVRAEKKDERKKKSLLRTSNVSRRSTNPGDLNGNSLVKESNSTLQGFMTSGELMQSMVENGGLNSSQEDGSTPPLRPEEFTCQKAVNSSENIINIASSPTGTAELASSPARSQEVIATPNGATVTAMQKNGGTDSATLLASNEVALSPTHETIGSRAIVPIAKGSPFETNPTGYNKDSTSSPLLPKGYIDISSPASREAEDSPSAHSLPLSSTAVVEVLTQESEVADNNNNNINRSGFLPPPSFAAADLSSLETATFGGSSMKSITEIADSQDFGSDEIKLPDDFIFSGSSSSSSNKNSPTD